jgi:cytochrome c
MERLAGLTLGAIWRYPRVGVLAVRAFHPPFLTGILALVVLELTGPQAGAATGDPERGAEMFRSCTACHSLAPGEHRTGPSLAGIFGREAGTIPGFTRYSLALEQADVTWNEKTLDAWLADPRAFIPGNRMTFRGIEDQHARADLIAYLEKAAAESSEAAPGETPGGMMGTGDMADLRRDIESHDRVTSIRYCADTYTVGVASGEAHSFWEFNLRFKTDSSDRGPEPGHPVLIPASMMGDRAFVIFADPAEISRFIQKRC